MLDPESDQIHIQELLLSNLPGASWLMKRDKKTRMLCAFGTQKILGVAEEDVMQKPALLEECICKEDRKQVLEAFGKLSRKLNSITMEYRVKLKSGDSHRVRETRFLKEVDGEFYEGAFIINIQKDVAHLSELDSSDSFAESISGHSLQSVYLLDKDLKIKGINRVGKQLIRELTGLEPEIGESMMNYILPENKASFNRGIVEAGLHGSVRWSVRMPVLGEERWMEMYYASLKSSSANIKGFLVTARDITAERMDEFHKRQRDELYRNVVEMAHDGIGIVQDGIMQYINPILREWLGVGDMPAEEVRIDKYVQPEFVEILFEHHFGRVSGKEVPREYEIMIRGAGNEPIPVEIIGSVIHYRGRPASLVMVRDLRDRKRRERELEEAHQKFQSLVEKSPFGIYIYQDERFIYINPRTAQILGFNSVEEMGPDINLFKYIHPEDIPIARKNIRQRLQTPDWRMSYTLRAFRKDGTERYIEVYDILTTINGKPAIIGTIIDNTERIIAEELLRKSEAMYRQFFDEDITGDFVIDQNGTLLQCNKRYVQILGYDSKEELYEVPMKEHYPEPGLCDRLLKLLAKRGKLSNLELRMLRKDGREIIIRQNVVAEYDEDGEIKLIRGYLYDITELIEGREKIRENEERLKLAIQATGLGLYDVNLDENSMIVNEEYELTFGRIPDHFTDHEQQWLRRIHPDHFALVNREFEKLKKGKVDNLSLTYLMRLKEEDVWVHEWARVISRTKDGKARRIVGALSNVTEEMHKEIERLNLIGELRKQNTNLNQFSYIISHNVRKHVANLMGLFEIIEQKLVTPEEQERIFQMISKSIKDLEEVILDLDDILYIREGKGARSEELDVSRILRQVEKTLEKDIRQSGAELILNLEVDKIWGVKSYIQSIFYNLVSNALKYRHHERKPEIRITTQRINHTVRLEVKDNGIGIDTQLEKKKLFILYSRLNFDRDGRGVGLYTVKTQVEFMGGSIDVEGKPGEGCTFIVSLPISPVL